jgi:hypothetical protein
MNQPPQTGKRIVSKSEYVRMQARRVSGWFHVAFYFAMALLVIGVLVLQWHHSHSAMKAFCGLFLLGGSVFMYFRGRFHLKNIRAIERVIPLTRANTANLPAPDSLVRASAEPMQEQQAVLLRAATETQERHEEQLVRPGNAPE